MIKKNDFVEIEFVGKANGEVFDTNIKEEAKKAKLEIKEKPLIVCVGQGMLLKAFDEALEKKEINKKYNLKLKPEEAFGKRKRELIKTIPVSVFREKDVEPQRGMSFLLDNVLVKIIAVSGGRVIVDFNNPLSGKDIEYDFKIKRKIDELEEKINSLTEIFFKQKLNFEINDKIVFKIDEKIIPLIEGFKEKFKEMLGKDIEVKKAEKAEKTPKKNSTGKK